MQVSRRTAFTGSPLIRSLARLADADSPESKRTFAERLAQWLGWTDAITLSAALSGASPATPVDAAMRIGASAEQAQCERVRSAMTNAIAQEMHGAARDASADFAPYRRRYVARQQAMETSIGPLRGRLRETLASRSPAMARLAAVDAVMEQALEAQQLRLLATVPTWLERHFKRSRPAEIEAEARATAGIDTGAANDDCEARRRAWLDAFGQDMQGVLLAELDLRLQPVEGLLDALRTSELPSPLPHCP